MPRNYLKSTKAIRDVLASGKRYSSASLELFVITGSSQHAERYDVAFLMSKKCGGAVCRNRIKRWLREDFRRLQSMRCIPGEYVLRFKGSGSDINHQQLGSELERLYGLLKVDGQQ